MTKDKDLVSVDTILLAFEDWVTNHKAIPPGMWIGAAQKLVALLGNETDKLFNLQAFIAGLKIKLLEAQEKVNVSEVRIRIEATPEWVEMRKQEAKIKRIEEFIRIAKIQARMKDAEMRLQ